MSQDSDISALFTILWLGWFYWQITSALDQFGDDERRKQPSSTACDRRSDTAALALDRQRAGLDCWHDALNEIERRDASFALGSFLDNAVSAYEIITTAFANGDCKRLCAVVSQDIYDSFLAQIMARECTPERIDLSLLHVEPPEPVDIRVLNDEAEITVRFVGEFFRTTYTAPRPKPAPTLCTYVDLWTFSKRLSSGEVAWTLVAANAG